jgi:hypothetical protein
MHAACVVCVIAELEMALSAHDFVTVVTECLVERATKNRESKSQNLHQVASSLLCVLFEVLGRSY